MFILVRSLVIVTICICIAPFFSYSQEADTTKNLQEVQINAKKAFSVRKLDRVVININTLISNSGATALEALEKSPGVQVDQNGIISLKGKQGVMIFIDDRPTYLSGEDLANYLKSLPASTLEQLEIMTNPPAKYDAAGNAGVINIRTKKGTVRGFNGSVNLSLNQGQRFRSPNSVNFNIRNAKVNYFMTLSNNHNNGFTDLDINRTYKNLDASPKSYFNQNSYFDRSGNTYNAKLGADYYQSASTTWGIVLTGMNNSSTQINNNVSNLLNAQMKLDSVIKAKSIDEDRFKNVGLNLNFRHQFDTLGHGITADGDYLAFRNRTDQQYDNFSYFPDNTLKSEDMLNGYLPADINIYSLKTDYSLPLPSAVKFSAGLKASYTTTDNTAEYNYTLANTTKPDYDKSNHFLYSEAISAAYVNAEKEFSRWSLQAGLRLENTLSNGHQLGNLLKPDSTFKRSYTSLFPTFYVLYKLDSASKHQINFNYGRRIDRPYYQDLNPFLSPLDKFTYYVGNPFLRPAYVHSIELGYTLLNNYTTTISYANSKDEVNETIEIRDGTYYSRPFNLGTTIVKSISFNATFDPVKWLNVNFYTELTNINTKSQFYTGRLSTSGTFSFTNANARLSFGHGWDGELTGNYRNRLYSAQFILGRIWSVNTAVQKKLNKTSTLKLGLNDIFYSRINTGIINSLAQTEADWINRSDTRNVVLSYSYSFGKAYASRSKHEANGAESERSRVKN